MHVCATEKTNGKNMAEVRLHAAARVADTKNGGRCCLRVGTELLLSSAPLAVVVVVPLSGRWLCGLQKT